MAKSKRAKPDVLSTVARSAATAPLPATDNTTDQTQSADLATMKRYFMEARDLTAVARTESLEAIDYYDTDQYTKEELEKLARRHQPTIVINRLKVAINGIIGVTEKGRSDPRAWPRNPGETDQADAATDVLRYVADFNKFKRLKQDCFLDMLVPGTMAALVGVDDDRQVTVTQIRWEEFFGDPRSRRKDWKDARFLGIAKWMYADDAISLYPDKREAIQSTVDNGIGGGMAPDASYQDRPIFAPGTAGAWVDRRQRRLMVIEIYWRDAGTWKRCVFTGSDILEEGASPYQDHKGRPDCPIEAMSLYVKRDNSRYGAARDMMPIQDEINKRRSKSLHAIMVSRIEVGDPSAINVDADVARAEAARPDGVIPFGWKMSPNQAEFQGNLELLQEAKAEMERMAPNPAMLGRDGQDASGRALMARQQSGLVELANVYGALEDWELRIYRQCWGRVKQFWTAPQFIRVTDDEDNPKFVGLNQPVMGDPTVGVHPQTGQPQLQRNVLGYRNPVAEMDVDIEIDTQQDVGSLQAEAFQDLLELVKINPVYQQQVSVADLIQISPIQHKRAILDVIKQNAAQQDQVNQAATQLKLAHGQAQVQETQAKAGLHEASAFAHSLNALSEAHATHSDRAAAGLEAGIDHAHQEQAQQAAAASQQTDIAAQQQAQAQQQAAAGQQPQGQ